MTPQHALPTRPLHRFVATVMVAGLALAIGTALLATQLRPLFQWGALGDAEDIGALGEVAQNSLVYDTNGKVLAVLHAEENRSPVQLATVPRHVVDAIVDVEDDRFWVHGGVNLSSTVRALVTNVSSGEILQGGSTITQQLVKNALLTPEKSISRKVREAVLAVRLEDDMSKPEILERYLNIVYFGNGAYGLQAAAETYFNSSVDRLTVGQATLLAGIIRNPVGYDPVKRPAEARARRDFAVSRMVSQGHLSTRQAESIRQEAVPQQIFTPLPPPNDYFVEEVKQRLLEDPRLGETSQERYNAVFKGGLRIHTTMDPRLQQAAEEERTKVLPPRITRGEFTSALASVEPSTGYVRAVVAGDDFGTAKYNLATQGKRQPGSAFKIFVLLAALDSGYSPTDTIDGSSPCTLKVPGFDIYKPGNYEGTAGGTMSLTQATANSVNCAYARLGVAVGLDKVVEMGARLGLPRDRLDAFPSISLGAEEVTPLEIAAAYAAIANDGVYHAPSFVEKVLDRKGNTLFEGPSRGRRAFSAQTARVAADVMESVVQKGTGTAARLPGRDVAGKTGTSQNHENAWFVGFTPQLSTSVWMGSPIGNVSMTNVGGRKVTGGSFPAQIWSRYMTRALKDEPKASFTAPNAKLIPKGKYIKDKSNPSGDKGADSGRRRASTSTTALPGEAELSPQPTEETPTAPLSPSPGLTPVPTATPGPPVDVGPPAVSSPATPSP